MKKIAIVTLMKNKSYLTIGMLNSVLANTSCENIEYDIYIADTGSDTSEKAIMKAYVNSHVGKMTYIEYNYYNFAKINNRVVREHIEDKGYDFVLFLNNDMILINDAINRTVQTYIDKSKENQVGTVGACLLYPNLTIQHNGIGIVQRDRKIAGLTHVDLRQQLTEELQNKVNIRFGNTGAFLLISVNDFIECGCFNEDYEHCFEDVELNLQCILHNKINFTDSGALVFHFESATRHQAVSRTDLDKIMALVRKVCGQNE